MNEYQKWGMWLSAKVINLVAQTPPPPHYDELTAVTEALIAAIYSKAIAAGVGLSKECREALIKEAGDKIARANSTIGLTSLGFPQTDADLN